MDILLFFPNSFRRGAPPRHEGRAPPRGRDGFPGPEDFGPEENFDASDETARGRDLRGRGRGTPRGKLKTMGLRKDRDEELGCCEHTWNSLRVLWCFVSLCRRKEGFASHS